jgi:hypothetical protein
MLLLATRLLRQQSRMDGNQVGSEPELEQQWQNCWTQQWPSRQGLALHELIFLRAVLPHSSQ